MTDRHPSPEELLSFPCNYEFKAFGPSADAGFVESVFQAVNQMVPVGRDAVRVRASSRGNYQCVSVRVRLENSAQLTRIYVMLRTVAGLRYLL